MSIVLDKICHAWISPLLPRTGHLGEYPLPYTCVPEFGSVLSFVHLISLVFCAQWLPRVVVAFDTFRMAALGI